MRTLTLTTALMLSPMLALADTPPPADALPLSQIIATLEEQAGPDLAYIDEVDWDDDGYWKVEYRTMQGARIELRLDPVTGEQTAR